MTDENSNPETGELSDEAASEWLAAQREQPEAEQPEEETTEAAEAEEVEETEGEPETEEQDEEEPELFTVKVDGEELQVTRDELLNGYQRDADYRRKTQAVAEERRAAEAERTRQAEITAKLVAEYQKLAGNDEPEPDWIKLSEEDPIGYVQMRAQWEAKQARKARAREQTEQLVKQQRWEIAQAEIVKLRDKAPEWRDPEAFKRDWKALVADASSHYGFSEDELSAVLDHRSILALRDAAAYRRLQDKKAVVTKKVEAAPAKVVKPGSPPVKGELSAKDLEAARNRMRRGSDDDAVRFLQMKRAR